MANIQQANVLSEARSMAQLMDNTIDAIEDLRERFNSLGGTPGFQGAGKLFAADGSGQEIPYSDFLGLFNALGALEGVQQWADFKAVVERLRG